MSEVSITPEVVQRILEDRPVAYRPMFAAFGGVRVAVLLSQLFYWNGKQANAEGWIMKTAKELTAETGMSEDEQETARNKLVAQDLIEFKRFGVPAMPHYRVKMVKIIEALSKLLTLQLESPNTNPIAGMTQAQITAAAKRVKDATKSKPQVQLIPDDDPQRPWLRFMTDLLTLSDDERRIAYQLAYKFGHTDASIGEGLKGKALTNKRERWLTIKNVLKLVEHDEQRLMQLADDYYNGPYQMGYAFDCPDSMSEFIRKANARQRAQENAEQTQENAEQTDAPVSVTQTQYKVKQTPLGEIYEEA